MREVVSHPVFGEGEVLNTRLRGTEVLCQFKSGLRLWLPLEKVFTLEKFERPVDIVSARRMIEAFRIGIVPHQDVENFTFGRDYEIRVIEDGLNALKKGAGGAILVEGEYGAGKTHLLEYIHHKALAMEMVTSFCEFDPREISPHRPKKVYREIVHNLRFLDEDKEFGFRDLLRRATKTKNLKDHIFFAPVLSKLQRMSEEDISPQSEVFWQWIEGESTKEYAIEPLSPYRIRGGFNIPALYDFSTAADFYCYILSGLSYLARELKLKGLVLLIDEAETVTHLWDTVAFTRGMNFLEGLIRTALNDSELKKVDSRMIHNQVRTTPYIYKDAHILLVIATTPMPYEYTYIKLTNYIHNKITLKPLRERDLNSLFNALITVYKEAYANFIISEADKRRLLFAALKNKDVGIRFFIKYCIENLDLLRLGLKNSNQS